VITHPPLLRLLIKIEAKFANLDQHFLTSVNLIKHFIFLRKKARVFFVKVFFQTILIFAENDPTFYNKVFKKLAGKNTLAYFVLTSMIEKKVFNI
jgi:hypothetical protein